MTGGLGSAGGQLLKQGTKLLGSSDVLNKVSPELGELADMVRRDLLDAGKSAASAAMTNRIDSLSERLRDRADLLRRPPGVGEEEAGAPPEDEEAEDLPPEDGEPDDLPPEDGEPDDAELEDEEAEEPADEPADEPAPPASRRAPRRARSATRGRDTEPGDEGDEERRPARPRSRTPRPAGSVPPVRRTRR